MSLISESLTIGLLLAIVFGAVCFYLYTRVTYTEKRISLMENILLDIKMNQETKPLHIPPPIPPYTSFQNTILPIATEEHNELDDIIPNEPLPSLEEHNEISPDEEAEYADVLNQFQPETNQMSESNQVSVKKYDSMTKDELLELVKQRGLRAGNRPGKEKLITLLEKDDEKVQPVEASSFTELQEAVSE